MARTPRRMSIKVVSSCPDARRVIGKIADPDVAARAQQAPDALPAANLPRITARVVMVNMPLSLATRLGRAADRAHAALLGQHAIEVSHRQAVAPKVRRAGVAEDSFCVLAVPLARVDRHARTAVRGRAAGELRERLRLAASRAPLRLVLDLVLKVTLICRAPLAVIRAVNALCAALRQELKDCLTVWACSASQWLHIESVVRFRLLSGHSVKGSRVSEG